MTPVAPISDTFPILANWLGHGPDDSELPQTAADQIAERFSLDTFARNLLLLCAYISLESEAQDAMANLSGNAPADAPTVAIALARLPGANWQMLSANAPLRHSGLITLEGRGGLAMQRIHLAETVLFHLLGAPGLGPNTAPALRKVAPQDLTPGRARLATDIAARLALIEVPVLHLVGPDMQGKLLAFAEAAHSVGEGAYVLGASAIPQVHADMVRFDSDIARDLALVNGRLVLTQDPTGDDRLAQSFIEAYPGPIAVVSTEAMRTGYRRALRLELRPMAAAEQVPVWRHALGAMSQNLNGAVPKMAATFNFAPETAQAVAAELHATAPPTEDLAKAAWDACRRAARPRMDDLAQRARGKVGWDDLILPVRQKAVLSAIVAQVRNRVQVYDDWRFAEKLQDKGLGVSALFCGPSGAGKSMAGEVIGTALDLDVYRVDLSSLVSKWVGETEKNLRRVFDAAEEGGIILQFDECDALFGKRTEVKDSHDRHANIEVSYLLQRLESYRGLCILTTNMRDNIDEAFLRRIRFAVDFRFPSRVERLAIWQRAFPVDVPQAGLAHERLAQLNVAGGSIRNIALGAAFLAADQGGPVTMAEVHSAARAEYDKIGRAMTEAETAGWLQ